MTSSTNRETSENLWIHKLTQDIILVKTNKLILYKKNHASLNNSSYLNKPSTLTSAEIPQPLDQSILSPPHSQHTKKTTYCEISQIPKPPKTSQSRKPLGSGE